MLEFDTCIKAIVMNLEEEVTGAVLLGPTDKIRKDLGETYRVSSPRWERRWDVIDLLSAPLDGKGLIGGELCRDAVGT